MFSRIWNLLREHFALLLKCGSVLFLFSVSVLIVACGANNTAQVPGAPPVTITINLNQSFSSPTPKLADYSCGAWATQTTPDYSKGGVVGVYAKFVHNVNGNPVGVDGATAQATVHWPDGTQQQMNVTTMGDGLAVFDVAMQASALNHIVLIDVVFTSSDGQHTCAVPQAAFFTAVVGTATPSPQASPSPQPSPASTGTPVFPFPTPTDTPGGGPPGPRKTPTPTPGFGP
jgi:hypothetical protein